MKTTKYKTIFKPNSATTISSQIIPGGSTVVGFNIPEVTWEEVPHPDNPDRTVVEFSDCEYVYFERVIFDNNYDITKCDGIDEGGIIATAPLLDDCGCPVILTACCNTIKLPEPGKYRAYYIGDSRPEVTVIFYPKEGN